MIQRPDDADRAWELIDTVCTSEASTDCIRQLDLRLRNDPVACDLYNDYCALHAELMFRVKNQESFAAFQDTFRHSLSSPLPTFLATTLHGTIGYFSTGWPVAYLVATAIFGIGLAIGSHVYMSHPEQVARSFAPSVVDEPGAERVGRITGMVDCKWTGIAVDSRDVVLGRKYKLASGLMEITYNTGAKVILQGPVTYEVESDGGYLSVGKLTGKLEKRNDEARMTKDEGLQNSSFVIRPSSFVIHTPTATVTDLGTEFGVEVTKDRQSHLRVFQGRVVVRTQASAAGTPREIEMAMGESAFVDSHGAVTRYSGSQAQTNADAMGFIRKIPKRIVKTLNLVDVVAGGDGFGTARDRGINPNTGEVVLKDAAAPNPKKPSWHLGTSDGRYHRVKGLPFIDGVFVPDDRRGPVQLDSAGHTFTHFGNSEDTVFDYIWAGGELPAPDRPTLTKLGFIDYGQPDNSSVLGRFGIPEHSVLGMTANKGITFDLEAIRRANPGCKIRRFRAVAGNAEVSKEDGPRFKVDVWVFVDGQLRLRALNINESNSSFNPLSINIPIGDKDRFLTLVASDGGDQINNDRVIFGDPRLEVTVCPQAESTVAEAADK